MKESLESLLKALFNFMLPREDTVDAQWLSPEKDEDIKNFDQDEYLFVLRRGLQIVNSIAPMTIELEET
jgi:hypothetical protein